MEADNHNNLLPEDNQAVEEAVVEEVEAGGGQPAAGQQAAGQAAAAPPRSEPLKGMIPQIFAGDRKDAERFMQQFGAYRFLNRHNSTFTNKAEMVAYALTFIKGPQVDDWAYDMADQLSIKVEGNPVTGDPPTHAEGDQALWDWFARSFRDAFTDSTRKQDAYSRLTKMELNMDKVDTSITLFKRLIQRSRMGTRRQKEQSNCSKTSYLSDSTAPYDNERHYPPLSKNGTTPPERQSKDGKTSTTT